MSSIFLPYNWVRQPTDAVQGYTGTKAAACLPESFVPMAWIVVWLGVGVGIFFRVHNLGSQSLWFDEGYTAWRVSHPPGEIIRLIHGDTAPPLYYLLLRGWTDCFGRSEAALRSLSALFSIATMFIAIDIARRLMRNPISIAAVAWAMGLSFLQTWYAQEARAYALMALLVIGAFDLLLCHLATNRPHWLVPIALTIAAAMYTNNMSAPYVLAIIVAWLILPSDHSRRRKFSDIAIVLAISLLIYLPWAFGGLPTQLQIIQHGFWLPRLSASDFFTTLAALAGVHWFWSWGTILSVHTHINADGRPTGIAIALLAASAIVSIGIQSGPRRRTAIALFTLAVLAPVSIAIYSLIRTPLFMMKVFLPSATLLPMFALMPLASTWLSKSMKPIWSSAGLFLVAVWSGACLFLVLTALTLYGYLAENHKENWRQLAAAVGELPATHRLIVFVANDGQLPFDYYYRYRAGDESTGVPAGFFDLDPPRTMRRLPEDGNLGALEARLNSGHYQQVMLVLAHEAWGDPDHLTKKYLDQNWKLAGRKQVDQLNGLGLQWYQPKKQSLGP
jgi:4-amino-4-deoxy-L-arabinose transferase-like glycosyltransferase